jgi:hypothetical protein
MNAPQDALDARTLLKESRDRTSGAIQPIEIDEASWHVSMESGGEFTVEWSTDWSRLVLTADLGPPSTQGEMAALNLALAYNATWREVGTLRLARDPSDGHLLLIGDIGPDDNLDDGLTPALLHFDELRNWWTQALNQATPVHALPPSTFDPFVQRI